MTESSIWFPFKETEFDEKNENRVLIQDSKLVPVLSSAQTFKKTFKNLLCSLYLDSLDSVKSTMGFINYWLAMKTRFVSENWKF